MAKNFIVYCYPRTGSYHLTSLLDSCSDVVCYGEIFKANAIELPTERKAALKINLPRQRDEHPIAFVNALRALTEDQVFGFKLFQQHIQRVPKLRSLLRRPSWATIVLYREPIETYASVLRTKQTNVWTFREGSRINPDKLNVTVHFTPESLKKFSTAYSGFLNRCTKVAQQKSNRFVIRYDQLSDRECLSELLRFLGSKEPVESLSSKFRKQYTGSLQDSFDNWSELQDVLSKEPLFPPGPPLTYPATVA
jgi:hypothetical protein